MFIGGVQERFKSLAVDVPVKPIQSLSSQMNASQEEANGSLLVFQRTSPVRSKMRKNLPRGLRAFQHNEENRGSLINIYA